MKISIDTAAGPYVLITGGVDSPEDMSLQPQPLLQKVQLFRADRTQTFDRGNVDAVLKFSKTRQHDNFQVAENFLVSHPRSIPATGTVRIVTEAPGGGTQEIALTTAVIKCTGLKQIGRATVATYELHGFYPTT